MSIDVDTLTITDQKNKEESWSESFSFSTSMGGNFDQAGKAGLAPGNGSTAVGANNSGSKTEGIAYGVLGKTKSLKVAGEDVADDSEILAGKHRDISETSVVTKEETTGGLNVDVTISNAYLGKDGLKNLKNDLSLVDDLVYTKEAGLGGNTKQAAENVGKAGVNLGKAVGTNLIGKGATIVVSSANGLVVEKAYVSDVSAPDGATGDVTLTVAGYQGAITAHAAGKIFVYGSEYAKGTENAGTSVDAAFEQFSNKPIILRDKYAVSGSDTAQIGWVEVTTEAGTSGYLWYLKSEHEARIRFEDQLEMAMIEAEKAATPLTPATGFGGGSEITGSDGLFSALESRGLVYTDADFGQGVDLGLSDFDSILG